MAGDSASNVTTSQLDDVTPVVASALPAPAEAPAPAPIREDSRAKEPKKAETKVQPTRSLPSGAVVRS